MKPYWISFRDAPPTWLRLGMGVTAQDDDDARSLAARAVPGVDIAAIRVVIDVDELEQNHVVPNMGNILMRGIWFPRGYKPVND